MVALSRRSSPSSSYSLGLIILAGSCLLSTPRSGHFVSAALLTRDQLYTQNGFVQNWAAPMPSTPVSASNGSGSSNSNTFIVQNWSTVYKTIAIGGQDISFVADPFSTSSNGTVMQVNYPKGSYTPSQGPVMGGAQFYATPFGNQSQYDKMMVSYDVSFPSGFDWVLGKRVLHDPLRLSLFFWRSPEIYLKTIIKKTLPPWKH